MDALGPNLPGYLTKQQAMNLGFAEQNPGLALSVLEEAHVFYDENEEKSLREQQRIAKDLNTEINREILEFEDFYAPWFDRRNKSAEENERYYLSDHWTDKDIVSIKSQGRKPYAFNIVRPYMQSVLGEAVGQKTEWRAVPASRRASEHADFVNRMLRWVAQTNRYQQIRGDYFRDGIINGVGVVGIRQNPQDPLGGITLDRCRPGEFMWDVYSAQNGSLDGVTRLWRGRWQDRVSLAYEFPEWRAEILNMTDTMTGRTGLESQYQMIRPKVRGLTGENESSYSLSAPLQSIYGNRLFVREWYRRRYLPKWRVQDGYTEQYWDFDTRDQADAAVRQLQEFYMSAEARAQMGNVVPYIFAPRRVTCTYIDQCILVGDTLLRVRTSTSGELPYVFYIPEWYDGDITSFFEHHKDPQRFHNRIISFIDQIVSGNKGVRILNRHGIPDSLTDDVLRKQLSDPNSVIIVNNPRSDFDARRVLTNVDPPNHNQLVHSLLQYNNDARHEMAGGLNRIGVLQSAGQSGKSAEVLTQAASTLTANLFDKFRTADQQIGERAFYLSQYLHPAIQMRAVDEQGNPEFFSMIENGIQSIRELKFDITVTEVVPSPTEMMMQYSNLINLAQQLGPEVGSRLIPAILERSNLPHKLKQQTLASIQQGQQQAQANIQAEMEEARRKTDMDYEIKMRTLDLKERQIEIDANPRVSLQYKMEPDPLTEATLLEQTGIDADPLFVAAGKSIQTMMDVEKQTLHQRAYNENLLPEEREALRNKAHKTQPVTTPKDRKNRSTK